MPWFFCLKREIVYLKNQNLCINESGYKLYYELGDNFKRSEFMVNLPIPSFSYIKDFVLYIGKKYIVKKVK